MLLLENDEVRIFNTNSVLDGILGIICGKASDYPGGAVYVVRVANEARPKLKQLGYPYSCVTFPHVCLERMT